MAAPFTFQELVILYDFYTNNVTCLLREIGKITCQN